MPGSQLVIMFVRVSGGRPRVFKTRSMWGTNAAEGRQKPVIGDNSGQAGCQQWGTSLVLPGTNGPLGSVVFGFGASSGLLGQLATASLAPHELVENAVRLGTGE